MEVLHGELVTDRNELIIHCGSEKNNSEIVCDKSISLHAIENNPAAAYLMSLNSKRSRKSMASILNIVAQMIGQKNLEQCAWGQLRRHHVQTIIALLSDSGKAPTTVNNYLAAIKGVALEAWTMKLINTEDYQHIKHVKSVKGTRIPKGRALSDREIKTLINTCEKDSSAKGLRDAAIISILLGCGLRRSELVGLNYEDVYESTKAIVVLGKGNKERRAYVPENAWRRLMYWIDEIRGDECGPLFVRIRRHDDTTSERLTDQSVYHILEERRIQCGIDNFSPHDLRRTFASTLLDNREDIVTVKDAMGHSSIITTQKYDRRGDDRLKRASDKLNF